MVACMMASKYIHGSLQLTIDTNKKSSTTPITNKPITPPTSSKRIFITSPQLEKQDASLLSQLEKDSLSSLIRMITAQDRNIRIARMELEFLHFLNYGSQDTTLHMANARLYSLSTLTFHTKKTLKHYSK